MPPSLPKAMEALFAELGAEDPKARSLAAGRLWDRATIEGQVPREVAVALVPRLVAQSAAEPREARLEALGLLEGLCRLRVPPPAVGANDPLSRLRAADAVLGFWSELRRALWTALPALEAQLEREDASVACAATTALAALLGHVAQDAPAEVDREALAQRVDGRLRALRTELEPRRFLRACRDLGAAPGSAGREREALELVARDPAVNLPELRQLAHLSEARELLRGLRSGPMGLAASRALLELGLGEASDAERVTGEALAKDEVGGRAPHPSAGYRSLNHELTGICRANLPASFWEGFFPTLRGHVAAGRFRASTWVLRPFLPKVSRPLALGSAISPYARALLEIIHAADPAWDPDGSWPEASGYLGHYGLPIERAELADWLARCAPAHRTTRLSGGGVAAVHSAARHLATTQWRLGLTVHAPEGPLRMAHDASGMFERVDGAERIAGRAPPPPLSSDLFEVDDAAQGAPSDPSAPWLELELTGPVGPPARLDMAFERIQELEAVHAVLFRLTAPARDELLVVPPSPALPSSPSLSPAMTRRIVGSGPSTALVLEEGAALALDLTTGAPARRFAWDGRRPRAAACSEDGDYVWVVVGDGSVIFCPPAGADALVLAAPEPILAVVPCFRDTAALLGASGGAHCFHGGRWLGLFPGAPSPARTIGLGRWLLASARFLDVLTGRAHPAASIPPAVELGALSTDASCLALTTEDRRLHVLGGGHPLRDTWKPRWSVDLDAPALAIAFSSDAANVISLSERAADIYRAKDGAHVRTVALPLGHHWLDAARGRCLSLGDDPSGVPSTTPLTS